MTKRTSENVLSPEVPHKRCFRSLSNCDKPVGGVNVIQNASLLPVDEQRCRKRPTSVEDQLDTDNLPRKVAASRVNAVLAEKNTCQSGTFEEEDDAVMRRSSRALQPESNKQPGEQNNHTAGDKVMHSDEDLSSFNSFQFWRVPLPELDLSLLEAEPCSETMET